MDLMAALQGARPAATSKCKFIRLLDSIPEDTPGYDEFMAEIADQTSDGAAVLMHAAGLQVSSSLIAAHRRGQRCGCTGNS